MTLSPVPLIPVAYFPADRLSEKSRSNLSMKRKRTFKETPYALSKEIDYKRRQLKAKNEDEELEGLVVSASTGIK